jgi:hypothetical protein
MCTRSIVVMMTNSFDRMFVDRTIIIEDLMEERGMADGMRRVKRGIEEKLVDGRGRTGTTARVRMTEVGIIDIQIRVVDKIVIENDVSGRRHVGEFGTNGVDVEDIVSGKKVEKAVIIRRG